ncbi:MAG TPA: CBS domain-containing protein [Chloroflexia bacterium]|nr:CBS domain-containing protein [Chloroflexia bacterium]
MLVRDIMTPDPITVKETTSIHDAARLLARERITGLPVLNEDGKLVGIVSESDLFGRRGQNVADVMTRSIISVSPETAVEIVSHLLTDHRIRRLPVLEGDKLVGIISRADIIRMMITYWTCEVCGEAIRGEQAPEHCPKCGVDGTYVHAMQAPGM